MVGSPMYGLMTKLKILKEELSKLFFFFNYVHIINKAKCCQQKESIVKQPNLSLPQGKKTNDKVKNPIKSESTHLWDKLLACGKTKAKRS